MPATVVVSVQTRKVLDVVVSTRKYEALPLMAYLYGEAPEIVPWLTVYKVEYRPTPWVVVIFEPPANAITGFTVIVS